MSKHPKKPTKTITNDKPAAHPWVSDGIDYGPAIAAVGDLAAWAFDLAARDVADWPEGQLRVRTARRYVLARLRGKYQRSAPAEDVLFTAGLLARIFEAEIGLGMSDVVGILDSLGLPTDMVPLRPRVQPSARHLLRPSVVPQPPRPAGVSALPEPCEECGCLPRFRNAA
ncbi:MAG: hypothetical protein KA297_00485 [Kofleriaceae bacterium]|nr:hypothetical protein [Kofleriaceae bacterium]